MHLKTLHNFLLLVLCTIGIGFASAPPAAALTINNAASGAEIKQDAYQGFRATAADDEYVKNGYRKITVKISGATGDIVPSLEVMANGGNANILNEFTIRRKADDASTFIVYYVPVNKTDISARIKVIFTSNGEITWFRLGPSSDPATYKSPAKPVFEGVDPLAKGSFVVKNSDGSDYTGNNLYVTSTNGAAKEISFNVEGTNTTGAPTVSFSSHAGEMTYRAVPASQGSTKYAIYVTWTPAGYVDPAEVIDAYVKMPGCNDTKTVKLRLFRQKPAEITGSISLAGPAPIAGADGYYSMSAISSNSEWTGKGRIVRELTVTGNNVVGNITLSVSPQGHYGLTVTPTSLPAQGGKVTIIYKPQPGDSYYNANGQYSPNENKWPVLTIKGGNANNKTVQLHTTWDKTSVTQGVPEVPAVQGGWFDPVIYECKTYKGRNTVSLRWELYNPENISIKSYSQSDIDNEADGNTKQRMKDWNKFFDDHTAFTYDLYRDGKMIVSNLDITSYVDMNVSVGTHTYKVCAHYNNGTSKTSEEKTANIVRDMAISQYILEEVYNYPIVDQEGYNRLVNKDNCFKAFGSINGDCWGSNREGFLYKYNNGDDKSRGQGAPGDGVRQGVFRNGEWYIAMVSNKHASEAYPKELPFGIWQGPYKADERGHILRIEANGINNKPLNKVSDLRALSNQSLALTEDKDKNCFYFRGYNGDITATNPNDASKLKIKEGDRYFEQLNYIGAKFGNSTSDPLHNWATPSEISGAYVKGPQTYRTHYMAARGEVSKGTGKLCFAQNLSYDAYIVDLNTDGSPKTYHKISAPRQAVVKVNGENRFIDINAGTENYIFPVEGEPNKYIHVMRSAGIFLVDVTDINNPIYTLITADKSEVTSASGLTFTLENSMDNSTEMFYIHGTSVYSNNTGHFRIDMPQRSRNAQGNYVGDLHSADFTDMVPMASKVQDEIPGFEAGNSNGMWFGTEDAFEDGINVKYIYQYVPGVRFAKYKFYPVQAFPPAQPKIDVVIRHDDPNMDATPHQADDITHFDVTYSWKRPANFGTLQGAAKNFKIDGYNVQLLDPNGNVIPGTQRFEKAKDGEDDYTEYGPFVYNQQAKPDSGNKNDFRPENGFNKDTAPGKGLFDVHDGMYTVNVTPVYVPTAGGGNRYIGETGVAQDDAKYTPEIYNIRAKLWQASGNDKLYRVDIDFNRAPRTAAEAAGNTVKEGNETDYTYRHGTESNASDYLQPEPASRFKIEVDKGDGHGFQPISNLRIVYDGNILYNPNDAAENAEAKKIEDNFVSYNPGQTIHHGKHDGYVKHDYNFGGYFSSNGRRNVKARAGEGNRGDKMYAQEANHLFYGGNPSESQETQDLVNIEKQRGAFPVVAYHMVDGNKEDISNLYNWTYRATALYADNQPYESIKGQASVQTTLGRPTTTGVDDVTADAENGGVHIWPVPAESELHISAGEAIETVSIFNISGACVATFEGNNDTAMTVNVDNLASGVYLVKVNANAARRLIKR
ncbi:MAG: T9SS type A sorting domain-containing protein [Muribaculaceae bacterium]